jgi:hypothetical protein
MSALAPWEIEENERWKFGGDAMSGTNSVSVGLLSEAAPSPTRPRAYRHDADASRFPMPQIHEPNENSDVIIDPQTARELKFIGAYDGYVKYHRQVAAACDKLREHLKKFNSTLFKNCELESLPERYEDISFELEENWRKRKQSAEAVKRGIFLATELIKAFPVYRFFIPLKTPLRLIGCMGDRLDASQVSLVIGEINRLPSAPYSDPSFLGMRCIACDRLLSFYLRTKEYEKALDACDCGITLEGSGPHSKNRFRHRKKALVSMIKKKDETKNSWSFNPDVQFKRSVAHYSSSNAALR